MAYRYLVLFKESNESGSIMETHTLGHAINYIARLFRHDIWEEPIARLDKEKLQPDGTWSVEWSMCCAPSARNGKLSWLGPVAMEKTNNGN